MASATESGANVFEVDYFGRPAYLAQSPQFYKQQLVGVFERVYEVGPVFRAEPHDTVRHLAEYVSLDVELGFIEDHRDVLAVLREVLAGMVARDPRVRRSGRRADRRLACRWSRTRSRSSTSATRWRWSAPRPTSPTWPGARAGARRVGAGRARQRLPGRRGLPDGEAAVLHPPGPATRAGATASTCSSAGLELVTGGQRLHRPSDYDAAIRARGEDPATYAAYLQAFEHGMPPHGGFAIGLERWTGRLVEAANVREVTLFPRTCTG